MKKLILFLACGLLIGTFSFAQTATAPKFGYINAQELLESMPEAKKADADLQAFAKTYQDQLEAMQKEYQKKVQEFQAGEKTMTEAVKEVKIKEIQDLQSRMESTQQSAQEKITLKKSELFKPILDKADKAIKAVATENGYDYIFDASSGALLHARESDNILPLVKKKLGIQ